MPIGPETFTFIAGPCAVESRDQTLEAAQMAKGAGATLLRGGAFKPRTSPYAFQGLGVEALEILADVGAATGLPVVTEVVDARDVAVVAEHADMLQVGTRNMANVGLLQAVGTAGRPVLLKRGMTATIEEWLMAAEYVAQRGNLDIVLCERGIRTFETSYRNTLDISAVPAVQATSHLPVVVDPSHAAGRKDLVVPLARAAIAVGADGVLVDVHPHPEVALCDGPAGAGRRASCASSRPPYAGCPRGGPGRTRRPSYGPPDLRLCGPAPTTIRSEEEGSHEQLHVLRPPAGRGPVLHQLRRTRRLRHPSHHTRRHAGQHARGRTAGRGRLAHRHGRAAAVARRRPTRAPRLRRWPRPRRPATRCSPTRSRSTRPTALSPRHPRAGP